MRARLRELLYVGMNLKSWVCMNLVVEGRLIGRHVSFHTMFPHTTCATLSCPWRRFFLQRRYLVKELWISYCCVRAPISHICKHVQGRWGNTDEYEDNLTMFPFNKASIVDTLLGFMVHPPFSHQNCGLESGLHAGPPGTGFSVVRKE